MSKKPSDQVFRLNLSLIVRPARASDLPKLEWYGQYTHFRMMFQRTFEDQAAGHRLMLVVDYNDFPIAQLFIHFQQSPLHKRVYFYSFRVMDMFQQQGIGTWLLTHAENLCIKQGFEWASIAVAKDNPDALRLYERLGYRIYGENLEPWSYIDHRGRTQKMEEVSWLLQKRLLHVSTPTNDKN